MKRWVRKNRRVYDSSTCRLCGTNWGTGPKCRPANCLACGSRQCEVNGLREGLCGVCYVGLLWERGQTCGYKGCNKPAVAHSSRVRSGLVCRDHLERAGLAERISKALAERDQYWEEVEE